MKKIYLIVLTLLSVNLIYAQVSEAEKRTALQLVSNNAKELNFTTEEVNNVLVSSTYFDKNSGLRMVYLQQSLNGIPIYNQVQSLAFKNDKLVSAAGSRIKNAAEVVNVKNGFPSTTPVQAVQAALADRKIAALGNINLLKTEGNRHVFGNAGVCYENITAELMYMPDGKQLKLVWQVFVAPNATKDMWLIRVDALTNTVLDKNTLTVSEQFGKADENAVKKFKQTNNFVNARKGVKNFNYTFRSWIINSATYNVYVYPLESPTYGTPSQVTDPWTLAPGNATSLKWHSDGSADYNFSRGNNVYAQEDRDANNSTFGNSANSTNVNDPLSFVFIPNFTITPTDNNNQQFAITNLFYWNNIIHDLSYVYGFDEVAGNFQANNQGRGGAGNDYVIADAQDATSLNNANFSTPVDGNRPRMQMFLWNTASPQRDGDLDNGVVVHEFAHGISNRLTGGPANTSCLGNAEQGGEGWSDYFALMSTTNWATATINDGALSRPMGVYVYNSPGGIRNYPYSTNMSVNPLTYANMGTGIIGVESHNIGEIWCMALWEMTWEIIQTAGINPNLFNASGAGGNTVALKLVTQGLKLQPCNPGFIDARNAILKADTLLYNGLYSCAIWKAFAKRGMGRFASQGSSGSATDQIADFTVDASGVLLTQSAPTATEGQNIVYNNRVTAGNCIPVTNFILTDTLPTSVTYVSGGSYNSANRVVTFSPITLSPNQVQNYTYTVQVNAGTYFTPVDVFSDNVSSLTIPATWTATATTSAPNVWTASATASHSTPNAYFATDPTSVATEQILTMTSAVTIPNTTSAAYTSLSFWHKYDTEEGWDGGVVEVSTNGGTTWSDLGSKMIQNGYNGGLGTGSALANSSAFTGASGTFIQTKVNLSSYAGQSIKIRFRFASDNNTAPTGGGWYVDDILIRSEPMVVMKSTLFNASNQKQGSSDTLTQILTGCLAATISTQPSSTSACLNGNATFSVGTSGTSLSYQWQVNTGSGFTNLSNGAPYSGVTTSTLSITNVTAGMAGYQYRVIVNGSCTPTAVTSAAGTLSLSAAPAINTEPSSTASCSGSASSFTVVASGASLTYQWQVNTGSGFTNLANTAPYSGVTTTTLNIAATTAAMNGYQYRCIVTSGGCTQTSTSAAATLTVNSLPAITAQPASVSVCPGASNTFTVTATGTNITYQWQLSTNGGTSYSNITGATASSYILTGITTAQNGYLYRCVVSGSCAPVANSNGATLTVYTPASITTQPSNTTVCAGSNTNIVVVGAGSGIAYQWQVSTDGGTTFTNVSGGTTATLTLNNVLLTANSNKYRVTVTGNCGNVTSTVVTLTVNPLPTFTLSVPASLCVSDTARTLSATLAGGTWAGSGVQGSLFNPALSGTGTFNVTYTATNSQGCTNVQANNIVVSECPERHRSLDSKDAVLVYPNPNTGKFNLKLNTDLYNKLGVKIYSMEGRYVGTKNFNGLFFGSVLPMDLRHVQDGVYMLYLYNETNGNTIHKTIQVVIKR